MSGWARRATRVCLSAVAVFGAHLAPASAVVLPDARLYELVSPPSKGGADVMGDASRVRIADDGNAVSFASLGGFGDVRGTGVATEYLSERAGGSGTRSNGWVAHAITPRQDPLTLFAGIRGLDPVWAGEFSADLSHGIFRAWSPVTAEDPNVVNVENLYLRDDLRTPGAGHYRLLTTCLACGAPFGPFNIFQVPQLAGASTDFSHVLFESNLRLTADASGAPNLYEWVSGTLRLAGILPDSACGAPPCPASGSTAGGDGGLGTYAISSDGVRIVFTDTSTGQIYQRIDGSSTVQVSASERTDCADHNPCSGAPEPDAAGPQRATYQLTSQDGSRAFFTSPEQLTNDDANGTIDLYMWDGSRPIGQRLTRLSTDRNPIDSPGDVQGVLGASNDGRYVYFVAGGQLVAGAPDLGGVNLGMYSWHEGAVPSVSYVGEMTNTADAGLDLQGQTPGLRRSRVTPDGRHLLFISGNGDGLLSAHGGTDVDQTTGCQGGACHELYVYSADSNTLACASCDPHGGPVTGGADNWLRNGTGASDNTAHLSRSLSADGRWVFFSTTAELVPADTNGKSDAYEYDTQTGEVHLLSSGIDPTDSYFMDASPDGTNVFFITRQQLVGWDTDQNYDLYDARVGGGFPEPLAVGAGCVGDVCHGVATRPPSGLGVLPGSTLSGPVATHPITVRVKHAPKSVRCKRGYVRKRVRGKVRCVKRPHVVKRGRRATAGKRAR